MQHPDEGIIHAWLDGALSPEEGAALEEHAASCAECSAAIAEARGLIAASSRIVSSLDIVPGGVIPDRKPVRRHWYASTQLRAAAAVLFVAGASMLLLRDRDTGSIEDLSQQVMSEPSPRPAPTATAPLPERAATAADSPVSAPSTAGRQRIAETKGLDERRAETEDHLSGQANTQAAAKISAGAAVADAASPTVSAAPALAPPPVPMSPATTGNVSAARSAPTTLLRDSSARRAFSKAGELSNVVVTGVASEVPAKPDSLTVISTDSAMGYTAVRYRTASGAEVLLTEERTDADRARARVRRQSLPPAAAAPPPPAADARSDTLPITTIEWFDAARTRKYVLSGRMTKEALEQIKARIETSRR